MIVKSLKDGRLCVRKESVPYPRNPAHIIQSADVGAVQQIQQVLTVAKLLGWIEYHDEMRSNNAITATYWELYNAGTLDEIKEHIRRTNTPVSEKFLFSMLRQMLRAMLDTIKAGILHTDAHMGNWFLDLINGGKEVKLMLGDWGNWKSRPNMREHLANDVWGKQVDHIQRCELCRWYLCCHNHLKVYMVQNVRDLVYFNEESKKRHSSTTCPTTNSPSIASQPATSLTDHLTGIEVLDPMWHHSGEKWLGKLEEAYDNIVDDEHRAATLPSENLEVCIQQESNNVPAFDEALNQLDWFHDGHREGGGSHDDPVHFWKVAKINPATSKIVSLEGRPDGYKRVLNFKDHTDASQLPPAWKQAHEQTKETLIQWGVEEEQPENEAEHGWQDEGSMTRYLDTSMPFCP